MDSRQDVTTFGHSSSVLDVNRKRGPVHVLRIKQFTDTGTMIDLGLESHAVLLLPTSSLPHVILTTVSWNLPPSQRRNNQLLLKNPIKHMTSP